MVLNGNGVIGYMRKAISSKIYQLLFICPSNSNFKLRFHYGIGKVDLLLTFFTHYLCFNPFVYKMY